MNSNYFIDFTSWYADGVLYNRITLTSDIIDQPELSVIMKLGQRVYELYDRDILGNIAHLLETKMDPFVPAGRNN